MLGNVIIHFQPERQNQLRRVCDRCHRSKSKCLRENDNEPCQRCFRANVDCVSSPPASRHQAQATSNDPSNWYGDRYSTLSFQPSIQPSDNDTLTSGAIAKPYLAAGSSTAGPSQPNTVGKSPVPTRAPTHGLVGLLQRLSNLNIDLMNHLGAIPETSSNSIGSPLQTEREKLVFIDVMSQICLGLPPSHTDTPEQTTDAKRILCSLNPASELLIFSTYLRLIEMNDIILRLMKDSIENKDTNSPIRYPFQIPDFTIGSFSLPSKTDTQSIILINVMDTMITRAREIVAEATAPKQTLGYRGDFQSFGGATLVIVPDLARSAIRVREDALVRMIEDLKKPISQSNV